MGSNEWDGDVRKGREAHYEELLQEQEESGVSVAAFAEEVGVSAATLYSWRRRLGRIAPSIRGAALVEVCVTEAGDVEDGPEAQGRMLVTIADGTRIELDASFDESALERLLAVLDPC